MPSVPNHLRVSVIECEPPRPGPRGEATSDIVPVSGDHAKQIAAELALRCWTPGAAQLPRLKHAYPQ